MAKDFFYNLNKRKTRNFFTNFQEILLHKKRSEITIDDITEYTGVSRATFYHYFSDLNELYNDLIEFIFKDMLEMASAMLGKHSNSIFSTIKALHAHSLELLKNDDYMQMAHNFISENESIIRVTFSKETEDYFFEKLNFLSQNTIEGKKINNISKLYSLLSTLISTMMISLQAYINAHFNKEASIRLNDFDFQYKMLKEGFKKLYP